jgi:DNA-binding FadR family transcriptional regulator
VSVLFDPLEAVLLESRRQTKAFPELCEHALSAHWQIFKAVRDRDPDGARRAMLDHLDQTEQHLDMLIARGSQGGAEQLLSDPRTSQEITP